MQNAHSITLQPLSEDETGRLVTELLGDLELPGDVLPKLVDQAEGNPLYAQFACWLRRFDLTGRPRTAEFDPCRHRGETGYASR